MAQLYSEPVSAKELAGFQMTVRRAAESRITVLSRAQGLADAAAVFDDPDKVNTDVDAQLAIKPADIQRAAKANLVRANSVVVMTQPDAGGAAPGGRKGGR